MHPRQEGLLIDREELDGDISGWMVEGPTDVVPEGSTDVVLEGSTEVVLEGSTDVVLDKYNKLVDAYNSVRY